MKLLKLIPLAAILFWSTACEKEFITTEATLIEVAEEDEAGRFTSLLAALDKADLTDALEADGAMTVFAPTNAAFDQLFADLGVSGLGDLSKEALRPILLYHVVNAKVLSPDLSAGYVSTLSPGPESSTVSVKIGLDGGVFLNNDSRVTGADIETKNGVIHVINKVLLPTNIVDIATGNDDFSILVAALTRSDLTTDFVGLLSGDGPFTVFAPNNAAFQALLDSNPDWNSLGDIDAATLEAVLKYHVISGANVQSGEISDGAQVTTVQGGTITTNVNAEGVTLTDGQSRQANVIAADVQGTNGIVHVIDIVILP